MYQTEKAAIPEILYFADFAQNLTDTLMSERWVGYIGAVLASISLLGAVIVWLLPSHRPDHGTSLTAAAHEDPPSKFIVPQAQQAVSDKVSAPGSQSNVLELPRASSDFVGYWGGYTHSAIDSIIPGALTGENPDRASIVFGRAGDTVFIASELYSSPTQRLIGRPRARISNPREVVIQYRSEDNELEYKYECHFRLLESSKMSFRNSAFVYDRWRRKLVGTVKQEGMLSRLLTLDERRPFARPSLHEVPKSEILTRKNFSASGPEREGNTAVVTAEPSK
jgi:hypothetical protein